MRLSDFLGPVGSNYPPGIDQVAAFYFGDRCSVVLLNGAQFLFPDLGVALEVLVAEANTHPQVLFTIRPPAPQVWRRLVQSRSCPGADAGSGLGA